MTHTASALSPNGGAREADGRAMIPSGARNTETLVEPKQQKQPTGGQGNNTALIEDIQFVKIIIQNLITSQGYNVWL